MRKLIGRFKRQDRSPLVIPAAATPVTGSRSDSAVTITKVNVPVGHTHQGSNADNTLTPPPFINASVQDNSRGNTYTINGNNNILNYGATIVQTPTAVDPPIQKLGASENAEYDITSKVKRGACTPGTRIVVMKRIIDWSKGGKESLYWLNGMAGTGKTTITFSACQTFDHDRVLGASFFCSRGVPDCREVIRIYPSIAAQLARRYPSYAEELMKVLRLDPDAHRRALGVQLRKLIINPWNARREELPQGIVIVVDALDECQNDHSDFLQSLFDNLPHLPFKVLLTSRPEPSIRDNMLASDEQIRLTFILHDVEKDMVRADIIKYLRSALPRESPSTIETIADLADSLFIYAATLARLLQTRRVNIDKCIQTLKSTSSTRDKSKMMHTLDELYREVLIRVLSDGPLEDSAQEIKEVLYTVVCTREPLTRRGLADIWGVEEEEIGRRLDLLRSVLFVSEHDDGLPITTFHASFPEFLLDESRSKEFYCFPQRFNSSILDRCLWLMNSTLHQNMCQVNGRPPNDMLEQDLIDSHISPGLRYTAVYWAEHWMLSGLDERYSSVQAIKGFLPIHAFHWIECLSTLGRLSVSVQSLNNLLNYLDKDSELATTAYEYLRLIQHAYDVVEYSAMEIYSSAIVWIPRHSVLHTHHPSLFRRIPRVLCGLPTSWIGPERIISIHSDPLTSGVISQDGNYLVSGSWDKTVRVWNLKKQIEECVFSGHTRGVQSVAIYGSQNRVVSGSNDRDIRVWDTVKREFIFAIHTPSPVLSVAASVDGKWLASGQNDGIVYLWDTTNGELVHSLLGHGSKQQVQSLSFTFNSTHLVSGSDDATACIWNIITGETEAILRGHAKGVLSVACSPVEDTIITGSSDKTACLWNISGDELQVLRGHSASVRCVIFMPDGQRVVTGSTDGTLRVWDTTSGETLYVFKTPGSVSSVIAFPDGTKIAASFGRDVGIWTMKGVDLVGVDKTQDQETFSAKKTVFSPDKRKVLLLPSMRILDTATLKEMHTSLPHNVEYGYGALSSSGKRIAASVRPRPGETHDGTFSAWNLKEDGMHHFSLTGHTKEINHLAFSYDERLLISASDDQTVRTWDVVTWQQVRSFPHPSAIFGAAISHDCRRVAAVSQNTTYIWDAESGQQLHQLETDAHYVTFTPDDRHLIASVTNVIIFDTQTWRFKQKFEGYKSWSTLHDGSSYALSRDGWVYRFANFDDQPRRVLWVPSQYRPNSLIAPFTSRAQEKRIYLPRRDGLLTLEIPSNY